MFPFIFKAYLTIYCGVVGCCYGPTIWMKVGQGPTALAVGAGGVVWIFLLSSIFSLFSLSLGDGAI